MTMTSPSMSTSRNHFLECNLHQIAYFSFIPLQCTNVTLSLCSRSINFCFAVLRSRWGAAASAAVAVITFILIVVFKLTFIFYLLLFTLFLFIRPLLPLLYPSLIHKYDRPVLNTNVEEEEYIWIISCFDCVMKNRNRNSCFCCLLFLTLKQKLFLAKKTTTTKTMLMMIMITTTN